jgi:hypothetical protein
LKPDLETGRKRVRAATGALLMRLNGAPLRITALTVVLALAGAGPVSGQDGSEAYLGPRMPYQAFDRLPSTPVEVGNAVFDIAFAPGPLELPNNVIVDWIAAAGRTVASYYGRFPVDRVKVLVVPVDRGGVRSGTAFAYRGAAVRIVLGRAVTQAQLADDWIVVHELIHLAFPSVAEEHHWIEEGLAVYVESIARVQDGHLPAERIWRDFVRAMPQGLPAANDRGLDRTPTWGRTYWGGAIFCLLAEVRIREATRNRLGLQDALRAILAAGGSMQVEWPLERALRTADAATGTGVLQALYGQMKEDPMPVDLPQLWRRLGIDVQADRVVFDDDAPLAAVRRAITAARP